MMGAYFPYYFYRAFELKRLRFHAIYGVLCFLILPYLIFFVIDYGIDGDGDSAVKYGVVIPFFYSIVVLIAIIRAIRYKSKRTQQPAVVPWATLMPLLSRLKKFGTEIY